MRYDVIVFSDDLDDIESALPTCGDKVKDGLYVGWRCDKCGATWTTRPNAHPEPEESCAVYRVLNWIREIRKH